MKSIIAYYSHTLRHVYVLALCLGCAPAIPAATLTVTNLADSGPGTLRQSITTAAPGDMIQFGIFGTITLNSELTISKNLRIDGAGPEFLKISGNNNTRIFKVTSGTAQIFYMTIADGRVVGAGGLAGANGENVFGGAIFVASGASLDLEVCVISNNVAIGGQGGPQSGLDSAGNGGNAYGGALACLGALFMHTCYFVSNTASGGLGGAGSGGLAGSGGQGWGGGMFLEGSSYASSLTVHANRAIAGTGGGGVGGAAGGGIYNSATLSLTTSAVASNSAAGSLFDSGGGIASVGGLGLIDCTIVGNQSDVGGGLYGDCQMQNTILAGNSADIGPEANGTISSQDYNLFQDPTGLTISGTTAHNITNNPMLGPLQFNPGSDIGLKLPTMAPLPGSPVIDKGSSPNPNGGDQRGLPRIYDTSFINTGNGADIGAIEIHPSTLLVRNTNASGPGSLRQAILDNNGWGGGNTIAFSNTVSGAIALGGTELGIGAPATIRGPGPDLLSISANRNSRVFTVLQGPTTISGLTIRDGFVTGDPGSQGNNGSDGLGGGIYSQSSLVLSNCILRSNTVVGGTGAERHLGSVGNGGNGLGGGICNAGGDLVMLKTSFFDNFAVGGGGGIALNGDAGNAGNGFGAAFYAGGGTNQIVTCSFLTNTAAGGPGGNSSGNGTGGIGGQGHGAGMYSLATVSILNSTFAYGLSTGGPGGSGGGGAGGGGSGYGGGIYNLGTLALNSSTLASNTVSGSTLDFAGGIYTVSTCWITNSAIAGNQADFGGGLSGNANAANSIFGANTAGFGPDVNGTLNSYDYNLVQSFSGANITGSTSHLLFGVDPMLGSLQNNGGPTLTMPLLPGSPAIDKGKNFGLTSDQRGVLRPLDLPSVTNAGGGDGTDIGAFEFLPAPQLNIQAASNAKVVLSWPTYAANYRLESATNLPPGSTWSTVNDPRTSGGSNIYITNSTTGLRKFYRLNFP